MALLPADPLKRCCEGFKRAESVALTLNKASDLTSPFGLDVAANLYIPHSQTDAPLCQVFYYRPEENQVTRLIFPSHSCDGARIICPWKMVIDRHSMNIYINTTLLMYNVQNACQFVHVYTVDLLNTSMLISEKNTLVLVNETS